MWNLILKIYKWTYLQSRNRFTNIKNKLMLTKGKYGGRDKSGTWDKYLYTNIHSTNTQERLTV